MEKRGTIILEMSTDNRRLSIGCVLVTLPSVLILDVSLLKYDTSRMLIYVGADFWSW